MSLRLLVSAVLTLPWLAVPSAAHAAAADLDGPAEVRVGQSIRVSGTGWTTTDGSAGSVVAIKLDDGGVSTRGTVRHPVTDAAIGNKTVWAAVRAHADGTWQADLPFPTTENATTAWHTGRHKVTALSGSMLEGDQVRSVSVEVDVVADEPSPTEPPPTTAPPEPAEPTWPHHTVQAGAATAWIEREVAAGDGRSLRIAGQGWTTRDGRGSTIAVKLNRSATTQYTRSGDDIVQHPSASGDTTIWVLITAGADGTFERTLDAPAGLTAGQYLSASLLSGRFDAQDVQRSATSDLIVVGGVPHTGGGDAGESVTCVPTSAVSTARVEVVEDGLGGTVRLTGEGWCHPVAGQGGSRVGVKIDEGAYSRTDTSVHQNVTIWAIVDADPATGELDTVIPMPSGATTGATGSGRVVGRYSPTTNVSVCSVRDWSPGLSEPLSRRSVCAP